MVKFFEENSLQKKKKKNIKNWNYWKNKSNIYVNLLSWNVTIIDKKYIEKSNI